MTDLLERTIRDTRARQLPDVGPAPPETPITPPPTAAPPRTGGPAWPPSAKLVVAILAVATLLAALGTWAATRADDDRELDDRQEQIDELTADLGVANDQVATLTADLDAATDRVATLTAARDELDGRITVLDTQLATATADVDRLTGERTSLLAERAALQSSLAAAEREVADLEAQLDTAADTTATLDERLAALTIEVGGLRDRAEVAEAQRDALRDLFPIEFESSLQDVDVTGTWNVSWDEAYCTAFPTCGRAPAFGRVTITETPEGYLRVNTGVFEAGLFEVEGALYAITESRSAAPACGADQRAAHVGLTLYAHDVSVAPDGTHTIEDLGATYVVDAPATAACPAGLAVYRAELSPVG